MKNVKFTLYALGIAFMSLFSACQKDVAIIDNAETPVALVDDGRDNSGGLQVRAGCSGAYIQTSGFFKNLRYTFAAQSKTLTIGTTNTTLNWVPSRDTSGGRPPLYFSAAQLGGQKSGLRTQLRIVLNSAASPTAVQAHHLIPLELCVPEGGSSLNAVVQAAAYNGYHCNEAYSAMNVNSADKTKGFHSGSHDDYTAWVLNLLTQYNNRFDPSGSKNIGQSGRILFDNLPACQAANEWIQCKLLPRLRIEMQKALARADALPIIPNDTSNKNFNEYFKTSVTPNISIDQL
jgi:hypothetical protein